MFLQTILRQTRAKDSSVTTRGDASSSALFPNSSVARLLDHHVDPGKPDSHSPLAGGLVNRNIPSSIQIKAQARTYKRNCKPWCSCVCHKQRALRNPEWLRKVVGGLFIGYTGLPVLAAACNESTCQQRSAPSIEITYHFPVWFLARVLSLNMTLSTFGGPELNLRMPRMVSWATPLWRISFAGDRKGLREIFAKRKGSPFDVNAYGQSALHV